MIYWKGFHAFRPLWNVVVPIRPRCWCRFVTHKELLQNEQGNLARRGSLYAMRKNDVGDPLGATPTRRSERNSPNLSPYFFSHFLIALAETLSRHRTTTTQKTRLAHYVVCSFHGGSRHGIVGAHVRSPVFLFFFLESKVLSSKLLV